MGYRRLLKNYLKHTQLLTGTDFVELARHTGVFSDLDLGELRTLSAELTRESYDRPPRVEIDYNLLLRSALTHRKMHAEELTYLTDRPSDPDARLTGEEFQRLFIAVMHHSMP